MCVYSTTSVWLQRKLTCCFTVLSLRLGQSRL
jgi:hypothetical protein